MSDLPALSGRRSQAARNDELILAAAREVFVADPTAPIAAVAKRAGVGISALYRRYPSKEHLLRELCRAGLSTFNDAAAAAVEDGDGDAWDVFATFVHRVVEADTHALTVNLAGRFEPDEGLWRDSERANELVGAIFERTRAAGVLRDDVVVDDLPYLFEQLTSIRGADEQRTRELRNRYLTLQLDGMRRGAAATALPGPPPTAEEQASRWQT